MNRHKIGNNEEKQEIVTNRKKKKKKTVLCCFFHGEIKRQYFSYQTKTQLFFSEHYIKDSKKPIKEPFFNTNSRTHHHEEVKRTCKNKKNEPYLG